MEREKIQGKAYGYFQAGFHCAEVVTKTILEKTSDHPSPEAVRCASGFGGGIAGTTEELCGAFTGGIIVLGFLLGREKPGEELRDCGGLIKEFKSRFISKFGSVNCHTILSTMGKREDHLDCVKLTAETAVTLSNLLDEFTEQKSISLGNVCHRSRERVEVGSCPFTGACCQ